MTLNEHIREFLVKVEHFVMYIDDAIASPDLVDFMVVQAKANQIRAHSTFIEQQIGITRKATPRKVPHESRKNSTQSSTSTGTKSFRDHDKTVPTRTQRRAGSQSATIRKNTGVRTARNGFADSHGI